MTNDGHELWRGTRKTVIATVVAALLSTISGRLVAADSPPASSRKVLVHHYFALPNASAAAAISDAGAARIADYDSFSLFSIPAALSDAITAAARRLGLTVAFHDEFDTLILPGGVLTLTGSLPADPLGLGVAPAYGSGYGLYVLQFIGPVRPDWTLAVAAEGGVALQSLNYDGLILAATPKAAAALTRHSFVQLVRPYHPLLKSFPHEFRDGNAHLLVQVANVPGSMPARARIRALISSGDQTDTYGDQSAIVGVFSASSAKEVVREPLVLGVSFLPYDTMSDERVAQSLSTNVSTVSGNRVPTQPRGYASWLTTKCSYCGTLSGDGAHGFRVSIADTGLDAGLASQHADLGSRVTFGTDFVPRRPECPQGTDAAGQNNGTCCGNLSTDGCDVPSVCSFCDYASHGTEVAGHAAGNTTDTSRVDADGFYLGTGAAPTAGIVVTRAANSVGIFASAANVYNWAADALTHFAYIQSHSHNQYWAVMNNAFYRPDLGGRYTDESHEFDLAVRGLTESGAASNPISQITLIAAAGNVNQDIGTGKGWVLAPGTAKNAIAAGAAESVRSSTEAHDSCFSGGLLARHTTFRNTWVNTKHGTQVTPPANCNASLVTSCGWDTYIKPDVMVPATQVTGPLSSFSTLPACYRFSSSGNPLFNLYAISSGTSFSAPTAAGAALIASRVYAQCLGGTPNPAAASPSLLKAMLVASTRSMRGGTNYAVSPWDYSTASTIGAAPNDVQGFGLLNIDDIVSATPARQYVNESYTFTAAGQKKSWTYAVDDVTTPVKIALAWSDAASLANVDQNGPVATLLLNDLDLIVDAGDGATCQQYYGNNFAVYDTNPDLDTNRGEESMPFACDQGHLDTKNSVEKVTVFPNVGNVSRFTVTVIARSLTAKANPTLATNNQDFSLFVYNAQAPVTLPAPSNLSVAANGTTATVSWSGVQGAAWFEVWRNNAKLENLWTSTTYSDATVSPDSFYVYEVRAVDRSGAYPSPYSTARLASTYGAFTDDPIQPQVTSVRSVHVTELRSRINSLRSAAGIGTFTFQTPAQAGDTISAAVITEMRSALDAARGALGLASITYTDPVIAGGGVVVKAVHVQELRDGTRQ